MDTNKLQESVSNENNDFYEYYLRLKQQKENMKIRLKMKRQNEKLKKIVDERKTSNPPSISNDLPVLTNITQSFSQVSCPSRSFENNIMVKSEFDDLQENVSSSTAGSVAPSPITSFAPSPIANSSSSNVSPIFQDESKPKIRRYPVVKCSKTNPWGDPEKELTLPSFPKKEVAITNVPKLLSQQSSNNSISLQLSNNSRSSTPDIPPKKDDLYLTRGFIPANVEQWKMFRPDDSIIIILKKNDEKGAWKLHHKNSLDYGFVFLCSICKKIKAKLVDDGTLYYDEFHRCPTQRSYKDYLNDLRGKSINVNEWIQSNNNMLGLTSKSMISQ